MVDEVGGENHRYCKKIRKRMAELDKNYEWFAAVNNINIHYNAGSGWTAVPGVAMTKITDYYGSWGGWAKMTVNASALTFCFNNGSTWDNNSGKNYSITAAGVYTVKNGVVTLVQ